MENIEEYRLIFELNRDKIKWRIRRRLSITSFIVIIYITFFYSLSPYLLNESQVSILKEFNSIIITIIGFNSSIVMLYIGAATYSDSHGNKVTSK